MVSLLAFRQRIWSLFSPNNLELNPNTVTSINKIQQSIKRKLSFSPDHDLEPALKKLEAGNADMRLKIGLKGGYLETTVSQDKLNIRAIGDTRERRWNEPARISAPKREKFADELKREKEDLIEEYKIEAVDHITTDDDDFKDWSQQELDFFNGLNDRGVVPMLWSYWKIDFPTLPEILFTSDKEEAIIKNWNGSAASGE